MYTATDNLAKLRDMFREGTTPRKLAEDALAELEAMITPPKPQNDAGGDPGANPGQSLRPAKAKR